MCDVVIDVIKFTVSKISKLNEEIKSPPHIIAGLPWQICAKTEESDRTQNVKCLLVYIFCDLESESTLWSCDVQAELCVQSHKKDKNEIFKFKSKFGTNGRCFASYIEWDEIMSSENGFVTNDSVTMKATIFVSNVCGVQQLPNFDFQKNGANFSDMILILNEKKLHVSKVYLSLYSNVFRTMFFSEFKERKKKEIVLPDVYEEFLELLRVIYPSRKTINQKNVVFLLKLADKYQIKNVINDSEQFLMTTKDFPAIEKLVLADKYNLAKLQNSCIKDIKSVSEIKSFRAANEYGTLSDATKLALFEKMLKIV